MPDLLAHTTEQKKNCHTVCYGVGDVRHHEKHTHGRHLHQGMSWVNARPRSLGKPTTTWPPAKQHSAMTVNLFDSVYFAKDFHQVEFPTHEGQHLAMT